MTLTLLVLRQFCTWCQSLDLRLFRVHRTNIERFARLLGKPGRAQAHRRPDLSSMTAFYRYAKQDGREPRRRWAVDC